MALPMLCSASVKNWVAEGRLVICRGDFSPENCDDPGCSSMNGLAGFSAACFVGSSETPAKYTIMDVQ